MDTQLISCFPEHKGHSGHCNHAFSFLSLLLHQSTLRNRHQIGPKTTTTNTNTNTNNSSNSNNKMDSPRTPPPAYSPVGSSNTTATTQKAKAGRNWSSEPLTSANYAALEGLRRAQPIDVEAARGGHQSESRGGQRTYGMPRGSFLWVAFVVLAVGLTIGITWFSIR